MPRLISLLFLALLSLAACAPVMLGLTAGQIATNVIKTAAKVKQIRQERAQQAAVARELHPDDFLDVGDPLKKALTRLGEPAGKERQGDLTYYLFPNRRLVGDKGRIVAHDLRVGVDGQDKITEIILQEASGPPPAG